MESFWDIAPEPDPEPLRKPRRQADEHPDDWQFAQDQYERHLDRMGGEEW